jgi:hypothetical protein
MRLARDAWRVERSPLALDPRAAFAGRRSAAVVTDEHSRARLG